MLSHLINPFSKNSCIVLLQKLISYFAAMDLINDLSRLKFHKTTLANKSSASYQTVLLVCSDSDCRSLRKEAVP